MGNYRKGYITEDELNAAMNGESEEAVEIGLGGDPCGNCSCGTSERNRRNNENQRAIRNALVADQLSGGHTNYFGLVVSIYTNVLEEHLTEEQRRQKQEYAAIALNAALLAAALPELMESVGIAGEKLYSGFQNLARISKSAPEKPSWNPGAHKSAQKFQNQMQKRGWTSQQIDEAIAGGKQFTAPNKVNPGNTATRYVHPETGRSVVLDDVTSEVLHVGGDGFKY